MNRCSFELISSWLRRWCPFLVAPFFFAEAPDCHLPARRLTLGPPPTPTHKSYPHSSLPEDYRHPTLYLLSTLRSVRLDRTIARQPTFTAPT